MPTVPSGHRLRSVLVRWTFPYFFVAAGTFLVGALLGAGAMAATSPEALATATESFSSPGLFPDRLTTWTVFSNNVVALAVIAAGAVTFGVATAASLLFNGLLIGVLVAAAASDGSVAVTLALVVPHGVVELPALFLVGGVAYRVTWRLVSYLRGRADRPMTRAELREAAGLVALAVVGLAVAAWIEANLTVAIARALLGESAVPV